MATVLENPELERFFSLGRQRAHLRPQGREVLVEGASASAFLAVAGAMAVLFSSPRGLDGLTLGLLLFAYAIACRARFDFADGYTDSSQLILVPMLFLLPTPLVPLVVSAGCLLGRSFDYATGRTTLARSLGTFSDCWHAVGPALVLVLAGAQVFSWEDWPIYAIALLAQFAFDFAAAAVRARLLDRTAARTLIRLVAPVYALDGILAPVGLVFAYAAVEVGPMICLAVVPLAIVLAILSRERQARIDQALELSSAYRGTAMLLGDVVEADDAYTGSHSRGVVELSLSVSDALRLDSRRRRNVEFAALLHDVGKISVPKEIINKAGSLDADEWKIMRTHTIVGEAMLRRVGGLLAEVGRVVRCSHEHFDGGGYPDGLVGEEIPIEARIVTCCDAFSAMTTTRSYRAGMPVEQALAELDACAGTQFDPRVAKCLAEVVRSEAERAGTPIQCSSEPVP